MTGGALAVLSVVVVMAQGAEQPARSPARDAPKVDLAPSIPLAASAEKAFPRVVCGMVVIPASPAVDPKILLPPPPEAAHAKIRRIVPERCLE